MNPSDFITHTQRALRSNLLHGNNPRVWVSMIFFSLCNLKKTNKKTTKGITNKSPWLLYSKAHLAGCAVVFNIAGTICIVI